MVDIEQLIDLDKATQADILGRGRLRTGAGTNIRTFVVVPYS